MEFSETYIKEIYEDASNADEKTKRCFNEALIGRNMKVYIWYVL